MLPDKLGDLVPLTQALVKPASLTCARAFADDETTHFLIPDASKRDNLRFSFEYYLNLTLVTGQGTYVTSPRCEGVAIWFESPHKESLIDHLRAGFPLLPLRAGWGYLLRESRLDLHFSRLRRELAPTRHVYLGVLAVDPACQGQGFASKLLRPMLEYLDRNKMPAYLETQNLRNVGMYRGWGFDLIKEEALPDTGLKLFLMLRQPKSANVS
ncbi:Acetyltransferase (GNAT) family protein [Dehalogenimonas formicexedens]|uniref:Acetyltransferase (GNAT) family protein n=1 Tax=Dehalogenimonas formicexedens TaxID=1839801 RepID=A0A1P8F7R9_9CHLR|nr:GNAT family N-acetyltransferase [Dehalogenimonas formicexedens]APV44521.1 Acetyltransferase (GNAT) family protein [Dehalogenimonas formicexedens]